MKKLLFAVSFALVGLTAASAQEITFEKETIDYGEVAKGANGERVFVFTNTGDKPLIIKKVQTSCGCTAAEYPKPTEVIAPGAKGQIKVRYNTNLPDSFNKSITVLSNAVQNGRKILRIKGIIKE
ncbi:DUF1573 domain-containing protein [Ornithobacterium rhinotracheale]|uniref:DUF1573 domain-containing protein n=1 Tax=Ornithobacterium rhinotracheale TaxID=28251 RepID=A0A3R5XU27_ORNRH|nr:DUF1573 domain-containing protein [Ornithobacterium rhinotracheale]QAR30488.1 DUF1573 domain-containing protein [Ornithobacterium rhinotracheale]